MTSSHLETALRTDDARFRDLPGYPFAPHYLHVAYPGYHPLRMHYVDEGKVDDPVVLLLHGCPTWSFLYRKVIAALHGASLRVIAPDHIGCGKSDKLLTRRDYRYDLHVDCLQQLIVQLDLHDITLVCQDWGGPIGLRVLAVMPERFARVVATNTLLPNAEAPPRGVSPWPGDIIRNWVRYTSTAQDMAIGAIVQRSCATTLAADVIAAYDAPFPDASYKQGMLVWPSLIPLDDTMPGLAENRRVWDFLEQGTLPFSTAFSDGDATTRDWEAVFQQRVNGARNQQHFTLAGAGHMSPEDSGEALAAIIKTVCLGDARS